MPGRTLATWYGGGESSSNSGYPEATPPYSRHHNTSPFDQSHYSGSGYNYYPNQGGSTPSYSGSEQRPYPPPSPSYQQHYSPVPSPVASPYHYAEQSGNSTPSHQQGSSHMSFSNNQQQQQGAYNTSSVPAQANYATANNHNRHSGQHNYSPSGSSQQWGGYAASPGPSPVMGSPSPAGTNTQQRNSSNSASSMSGQFSQGAQAPPGHWQNHQSHGHGMQHQSNNHNMVANMSPPPSLHSQPQYYQQNNAQAASPQQLDLSCSSSMQPVDLHSPGPGMHSPSPTPSATWSRNTGGSSSPLASLQMLVNQDMNRQASAAYPQGMVDLSIPRGNTPHQMNKPEELRNGTSATTTSSPPALNGDLSSGADSGISSPMMAHLHPPDKPIGPRISVKSPQRLAAEVERQVRAQRATPSPTEAALNLNKSSLANRLSEPSSEPEGSPSSVSREARTKASMKRARKVDSILENLVESGTKKKRATSPDLVVTPVICVPPSEDSGMEVSPNSPNKVMARSPVCREDTVSPTFDDASQDSKPRRKRKPDNPTRLKSPEEGKNINKSEDPEPQSTPSESTSKVEEKEEKSKPEETVAVVDLSVKPASPCVTKVDEKTPDATPEASFSKSVEKEPFKQIENELAKMFEGIVSENNDKSDLKEDTEPQPGTSEMSTPSKGKRGRPKGGPKKESDGPETPLPKKQKKSRNKNDSETPSKRKRKPKLMLDEEDFVPEVSSKKKKKRKSDGKSGDDKKKNAQESTVVTPAVERCRGPYVRIEGPRDLPTNVTVYNSTRGDDDEGDKPATAPALKYRKKLSWHNEKELRNRVQGLGFSSTMASHYDAFTADESWRCAFCKRGSHSDGLGDLFGPYFIQQKTEVNKIDVAQQVEDKKSKSKKKRRKSSTEEPQKMSKKSKKEAAENARKEAAAAAALAGAWEVWVHEPCAIWAAGVHLVGAHMVGLQEAVWGAANSVCRDCGETGANLGCVRRTCGERAHYNCAKNLGWQLDEEGYVSCCSAHMRGVAGNKKVMK